MKKLFLLIALVLLFASAFALVSRKEAAETTGGASWIAPIFADKNQNAVSFRVAKGKIFADIANAFGINYAEMLAILEGVKPAYNLEKIVEGKELGIISDQKTRQLAGLVYQIDSEEALVAKKGEGGAWSGERMQIPYEIELEEIAGTIDSSLFLAITEAGGDERVALALAEMFQWQIDFGADIRQGDMFKAIYEKRLLSGRYIAPGNILAGKFINDGEEFLGVHFESSGDPSTRSTGSGRAQSTNAQGGERSRTTSSGDKKGGYYDLEGLSLQKIFLKSPLSYKYISSGFSYNRLNPVTRTNWGPHRAIDYAANYGTPVVTVGDGMVSSAGWHGGLGNAVFVRHNDTYATVYAHLSKFAVRTGSRVKQGQVVGYVGATGDVTGPHLHFELRKFGTRVNPLTIELPPGDPISETDRKAFGETVTEFKEFFAT